MTGIWGLFALTGALLTGIPAQPAAAAEGDGRLLVALDVSGSMNEPDGTGAPGATKISAARSAIGSLVGGVPAASPLGLRTYGGSCTSTSLLVPVGPVDKSAFDSAVAAVRPSGDTPIALALQKAAADLPGPGRRTILLVSDGKETCGGDPVAEARKLAAADIGITIDVIGFRLDKAGQDQLTDVAQAGGGRFYDVQSGAELASRLRRAADRALRPYRPAGTPVTGTPVRETAPVLRPGEYLDVMPPTTAGEQPFRHYAIDVPAGATAYASATVPLNAPPGIGAANAIRVGITTVSGEVCASSRHRRDAPNGGYATAHATATMPTGAQAPSGTCGGGGRFLIQVDNLENMVTAGRSTAVPMEITVLIAPEVRNSQALPAAWTPGDTPKAEAKSPAPTAVSGGGSYGDAPLLGEGVFTDTARPGEEIYYRVRLDWGQRLVYRLDLAGLPAAEQAGLGGKTLANTGPLSPVRNWALLPRGGDDWREYTGAPLSFDSATAPVRHRNLESGQPSIAAASLPGDYFIWLQIDPEKTDPALAVPFTLTVDVVGDPEGAPQYRDWANLGAPEKQLASPESDTKPKSPTPGVELPPGGTDVIRDDDNTTSTAVWITVATAGAVLVAAGVWAVRRKLRGPAA
ncbi:vWA domain-containing protein [Yinghuangia soli]|uniref:VWA domain-containing protein n=1 Tax=Yinghuangia soli TaxID=2908204 RepID=A0AA41U0Q4_9ACTN|nr:VWA domain-containing protein [Yinghuangia soli]MCF2528705.1 VWA domain-containing protein [Yinghuangia soli]MCF2531426.1 VWA domain-containing protein [Yinghuangia soli]